MKQEMIGWQWHQMDHMQSNCTSLQTDSHTNTSPLSFYQMDALPATQPTMSWQIVNVDVEFEYCSLLGVISDVLNFPSPRQTAAFDMHVSGVNFLLNKLVTVNGETKFTTFVMVSVSWQNLSLKSRV